MTAAGELCPSCARSGGDHGPRCEYRRPPGDNCALCRWRPKRWSSDLPPPHTPGCPGRLSEATRHAGKRLIEEALRALTAFRDRSEEWDRADEIEAFRDALVRVRVTFNGTARLRRAMRPARGPRAQAKAAAAEERLLAEAAEAVLRAAP